MKPITVIIGPQASGKTTKLKQLIKGKKSMGMEFHPNAKLGWRVPEDIEVIFFDEQPKLNRNQLYLFLENELYVEQPCKDGKFIDMPEVIITSQLWRHRDLVELGHTIYSRLTVIDLYK